MANPLDQIPREHIVMLKGRAHPTYPGVLAAAYANGLVGLEAKIEQFPAEANGWTAVCSAVATFRGEDGRDRVYAEVGDADPNNCTPHIAPHKIRMAATRAKGRALRDALGIGVALKEEIDGTSEASDGYEPERPRGGVDRNSMRSQGVRQDTKGRPPQPAPAIEPTPVRAPGPVVADEEDGADADAVIACEVCEQPLSEKSVKACVDHDDLFDGKMLCLEHRKDYRDRVELGARAKVPSGILA
jgi:hypothetical protein